MTATLVALFVVGYFGLGRMHPVTARELWTSLDDRIPFLAFSVWAYLWSFPAALLPLFVVRCRGLLRRTASAYAAAFVVAFASFALFPVTSARLRVSSAVLHRSNFSEWAVSVLYLFDPPYNLFPSLHVAIAALSAYAVGRADKRCGVASFGGLVLVCVAVCTTKQHFLIDLLGGLGVACAAGWPAFRCYRGVLRTGPACSRRGPAFFLLITLSAYGCCYLAFLHAR